MPIDRTLRHATEIADALDHAHRLGVVHRDLKPANVMLTRTGLKLLDFGVARLLTDGPSILTTGTTQTLTEEGAIVGTLQYMAPEQVEGRAVDARADIFAFGAVVYEMATGEPAFKGQSPAATIAAILEREAPRVTARDPLAPPLLDRIVTQCLAKDPDERWQTARDVARQLRWIVDSATVPAMPVFRASPHRRRRWILGGAVTVAAAAVVLGLMFTRHSPASSPAGIIRLIITPPPDVTLNPSAAALAVSPDGRTLAFVAASPDGRSGLWVRPFDSIAARRIPGTDGAVQPFWSPDSRYLAFISEDGKLKRVDVASGVTETIAEGFGQGGAWNHDGVILWKLLQSSSLMRVSASGGPVTAATVLNAARGETAHASPQFLPDGRHFLYLARSRQPAHDGVLCVASLDAPVGVELLKTESAAAYAPPGFLLYVKGNTLLAHPFDAATLRLSGDPMPVAEQVENNTTTHRATFSVSQTGVLAYRSLGGMQLMWMDRSGRSLDAVGPPGIYSNPALSADERMLAVARNDAATNAPHVWTLELARGVMSRLTSGSSGELMPVWSRDGRRIAYKSGNSFYQMASSGTGDPELLLSDAGAFAAPLGWSRDGRAMLYEASTERTRLDLMLLPLDARTPRVLLRTPFDETQAQPSPDGRWLAYVSNESGSNEVYVRSFDSGDGKWRISTASGTEPQWRRDGRELFYLAADRRLMAVPVGSRSTFDVGSPSPLFETRMSTFRNPAFTRNQYVVAGSEPRFLVSQPSKETSSSPVTVIVHWTEGLKP